MFAMRFFLYFPKRPFRSTDRAISNKYCPIHIKSQHTTLHQDDTIYHYITQCYDCNKLLNKPPANACGVLLLFFIMKISYLK